jgi:hypothetical protein
MSDDSRALIQRVRELVARSKQMSEAARRARQRATALGERVHHALTSSSHDASDASGVFPDERLQDLPREIWDQLLSFARPAGDGTIEIADWNGLMDVVVRNAEAYPALLNIVAVNETQLVQHLKETGDNPPDSFTVTSNRKKR